MKARSITGRAAALVVSAIAALTVAGTLGAAAASASTPVTATTSVTNHPDTTIGGLPGTACGTSPGGPVWALDNFSATFTATQEATPANTWAVHVVTTGNYVAFADPTTCDALLSTGSLNGTYDLTVTSTTPPSASALKASYDGAKSFSTMVGDLFGNPAGIVIAGGAYDFSYQGGNYVQDASGERGDVTAVACTVTVSPISAQTSVLNAAISGLQVSATSNYPGTLYYDAKNLPKGLSIDHSTGKITGTPTQTGTDSVTVGALNEAQSNPDKNVYCSGTAAFNWTVALTAPSPSPSSTSGPGSGSGSSSNVPTGGVQTGGGKPAGDPFIPFGFGLGVLALVAAGTAGGLALRRQHQGR